MGIEILKRDESEKIKSGYLDDDFEDNKPRFLEELVAFGFSEKEFKDSMVIMGSGPMAVHGIRENGDLDVLVSNEIWKKLIKVEDGGVGYTPSRYKRENSATEVIKIGNVEIVNNFLGFNFEDFQERTEEIGGYRYANLELVKDYKSREETEGLIGARPKDRRDIEKIEKHQNQNS